MKILLNDNEKKFSIEFIDCDEKETRNLMRWYIGILRYEQKSAVMENKTNYVNKLVKEDDSSDKPRVGAKLLLNWLVVTKKTDFTLPEFFSIYPKLRKHLKNIEHLISEMISANELIQIEKDKFRKTKVFYEKYHQN